MGIVFAGLMCHAPIVHPAVAGPEARRCRPTTRAMREVAARAVAHAPQRLVLVSPHAPRRAEGFAAWAVPRHRGDLGDFHAPQVQIDLPDAPEVARTLGLPTLDVARAWRDHGCVVPLAFLVEAGWQGPTALLALPAQADPAAAEALGRALAALPGATALIASGDMSHRLQPGAPAGYHPLARDFDHAFVTALEAEDWAGALQAEPRHLAAEDVVDSTAVAMAAAGAPCAAEVLAYEGPWGVGYAEAILFDPRPPLYAIARRALRDQALGRPPARTPPGGPPAHGVFVSLHVGGQLRGCMGHVEPRHDRLYAEVAEVARLAAARDPRFPALRPHELEAVDVEVSVLQPPERVRGPEDLDPQVYGVIGEHAGHGALLLPGLEGIDSVPVQLAVLRRKAGLPPDAPLELQRFTVTKEAAPPW